MYIAILGRQPHLGIAELERMYGAAAVRWFGDQAATVETDDFDIGRLGGTLRAGRVVLTLPGGDWRSVSTKLVHHYSTQWAHHTGKLTLGISVYDFPVPPRDVQKLGLLLKGKLRKSGVNLRLIPNAEPVLSTATSHHNKLGLSPNKIELIIVRARNGQVVVAESTGSQNITAYTRRDQARPRRDAFVGMLPPKLAQIMVNLAVGQMEDGRWKMEDGKATPTRVTSTETIQASTSRPGDLSVEGLSPSRASRAPQAGQRPPVERPETETVAGAAETETTDNTTVLDPFCGTGVVLQEAALMGYGVYGTDLSDKMIRYSRDNLNWLNESHHISFAWYLHEADAMTARWRTPIDAVVCEGYLGQPFSAPPSPAKLTKVRGNCNHIMSKFLANIATQLRPGTPLCVAIPAWRDTSGHFTHLPLIDCLGELGYQRVKLTNVRDSNLLYYREDQVVARELLILVKV